MERSTFVMEAAKAKPTHVSRVFLLISIFVLSNLMVASIGFAERGRVRVVDGTVVADNGSLLRAAHGNYNMPVYKDLSWWTDMRDNYNLNAVRLDTRITWPPDSDRVSDMIDLDAVFRDVDVAVNRAGQADMYIIIDNHTACCGKSNRTLAEAFWGKAAPRYKNRTHVIYEMQNEPVGWLPEDYTAADIQFQVDMYKFIRARAPNTHIILWSFAKANSKMKGKIDQAPSIDYGNASVGIHPYRHASLDGLSAIAALKASYPVVITEFAAIPDKDTYPVQIWNFAENEGISWMYMDLRFLFGGACSYGYGNYGDGVWDPDAWPVSWPPDPYYN
jgi:hypothetical protein